MNEWQERVDAERAQLGFKISRLTNFIGSLTYNGLPGVEQLALQNQLQVMEKYHYILTERMSRFEQ